MEEWRPVKGWEGFYEISSLGNLRSVERVLTFAWHGTIKSQRYPSRLVLPKTDRHGYRTFGLRKKGFRRFITLHRLVAIAFLGDPPTPLHQVNHKNGIREDNRVENLEWVTASENHLHAIHVLGRVVVNTNPVRGEAHRQSKLTLAQVREMRSLRKMPRRYRPTYEMLGNKYGVNKGTIAAICVGKSWAWDIA